MEKLTIEEKAKAYDKAVERAKAIYYQGSYKPDTATTIAETLQNIFPELAESEDERIRKKIIKLVKDHSVNHERCQMETWLERRGQTFTKKDIDDAYLKGICDARNELEKQGEHAKFRDSIQVGDKVTRNEAGVLVNLSQLNRVAKKDEKQGGHTAIPADAVLDSNKDGLIADTIRCKREKQGELKQKHFELKAGHWYICHRAFCCRADHLTVKEGERFLCEKDNVVKGFVIKEPEKYFKEISTPAAIETEQKSDITDDCKITPYGEKRDFGYFDKQKSSDKTPYPETLEKAIDLYYYSYGNGEGEFEHLSLEKFRDIVHTFVSDYGQKPWSEEDEQYLLVCKNALAKYQVSDKWDATIISRWLENKLKSLRPQIWTKEDEERYISCLQRLGTGNPEQPETINSKWFKEHVYPQNKWKPSDEQVLALRRTKAAIAGESGMYEPLNSLYEDLKKLRKG